MVSRVPKVFRIVAIVAALLIVGSGLALPWAFYWRELKNVDGRPAAPASARSPEEVNAIWAEHEPHLTQEKLSDISPYWFYFFLGCATELYSCSVKQNMSEMAGFVALTYLRDGHFTRKSGLHWHTTGMCLTIWIQRTMTASDLANAYVEAKSLYRPKN